MKKILFFVFTIIGSTLFAQIPNGYYNTATGTGYTLKTQLYNIIKGHNTKSYDALYTCYMTSDRDYFYENDGTILDMYSENPTTKDPYNYTATVTGGDHCGNYKVEGDCYNREHIIPQSVFNSNSPMVSDPHSVVPSDGKVNGIRSNYPHGMVGNASTTTKNSSKLGSASNSGYASGYSGTVFEPIDEFKGDIARMYFYFATRYEDKIANYSYDMFNGTSNQVFTNTFLEILKQWHNMDPVNQREIDRNNAIYKFQNNRNPYIDHPEYVESVWGKKLSNEIFEVFTNVIVYPNPSNNHKINIQSEKALDSIEIININGQLIQVINNPEIDNSIYTIDNLPSGFFFLKITANNQSLFKKIMVN